MASAKIPRALSRSWELTRTRADRRQVAGLRSVRRAVHSLGKIEQLETRQHLTAVTGFTLVDAITNNDIGSLTNGAVLNLATLGTRSVNVRINADSTTESVDLYRNGTWVRTENSAPYALYSDEAGDYNSWTPDLGAHTISATPYSKDLKLGVKGPTSSVSFTVIDQPVVNPDPDDDDDDQPTLTPAVTSFTLYNADTNQPIGLISDGDTINLGSLATSRLNIKANTVGAVSAVVFGMGSLTSFYTDTKSDFFLRGDNGKGDVYSWIANRGRHTLTATPKTSVSSLTGSVESVKLNFTVVDTTASAPTVSLVNPKTNTSSAGPGQYVVLASATDIDGVISRVEFYVGTTLIGMTADAPYSIAWTDVAPGTYALTAKAYDNSGLSTVSSPVSITVKPFTTDRTIYVSPSGNDANPGTAGAPFKTIYKAAKIATAGTTVLIQPGTYRETIWLDKSGTADKPITFKAVTPGTVVIDGSEVISGWTKESGATYSTTWSYDFFISGLRTHGTTYDGTQYAEQFIVGNTPLTRVETADKMFEGAFWINYDTDKVHVWLPKSADARTATVRGSTRSTLFAPADRDTDTASYVRVEGLTFRHASNFAQPQQAAVRTSTGWTVIDTQFQYVNGTALGVFGNDITLLRVTAENNGQAGIGGALVNNVLVKDSITRFNNYRKVRVDWEGGGGKWARSNNVYMTNYTANGNFGHGIWFDTDNVNSVVIDSHAYDNVGVTNINQGTGIFVEIGPGPTRFEGNYVHDQSGAGIRIAESSNVTVRDNIIIDNDRGIELRDMVNRPHAINDITIVDNEIRGWRESAIGTLQGTWNASTSALKNITIEGTTYDYTDSTTARMFRWGSTSYKTLTALQTALGFEDDGLMGRVIAPAA